MVVKFRDKIEPFRNIGDLIFFHEITIAISQIEYHQRSAKSTCRIIDYRLRNFKTVAPVIIESKT